MKFAGHGMAVSLAFALLAGAKPGDMRTTHELPFCTTPDDVEGKIGAIERGNESAEFDCYILGAGQRVTIEKIVGKTKGGNIVKVRTHLLFGSNDGYTTDAGMTPW